MANEDMNTSYFFMYRRIESKKVLILKCKEISSGSVLGSKNDLLKKEEIRRHFLMAFCRRVPSLLQEQSEGRLICVNSSNLTAKVFHLSPPTGCAFGLYQPWNNLNIMPVFGEG